MVIQEKHDISRSSLKVVSKESMSPWNNALEEQPLVLRAAKLQPTWTQGNPPLNPRQASAH